MSTAVMPKTRSVTVLGRVEAVRLARHPFFLIGVAATAVIIATSLGSDVNYYDIGVFPAFFLGMFSMLATFRLTRSMARSEEALVTAPSDAQDRVLALCLACLLPAALGLLSLVAILAFQRAPDHYAYGTWSQADRAAIFTGEVLLASLGAPLLGVAAGRWLRFPGAPVIPFVGLFVWVSFTGGLTSTHQNATWSVLVRLSAPWAQFTSTQLNPVRVESWRGSPWWYLGWLVALCVLAVLGALLKGAEAEKRSRLLRTGLVVGLVGLGCLVLAVVLGPEHASVSTVNGTSRL